MLTFKMTTFFSSVSNLLNTTLILLRFSCSSFQMTANFPFIIAVTTVKQSSPPKGLNSKPTEAVWGF